MFVYTSCGKSKKETWARAPSCSSTITMSDYDYLWRNGNFYNGIFDFLEITYEHGKIRYKPTCSCAKCILPIRKAGYLELRDAIDYLNGHDGYEQLVPPSARTMVMHQFKEKDRILEATDERVESSAMIAKSMVSSTVD